MISDAIIPSTNDKKGSSMAVASADTKKERFEALLDSYALALHLTNQIMDSGLLEKKIKLGSDVEKISEFVRTLLPRLASEIRVANNVKRQIISTSYNEGIYFRSSADIAQAYFDELAARGGEWEFADLEGLFLKYKTLAEEETEYERNGW